MFLQNILPCLLSLSILIQPTPTRNLPLPASSDIDAPPDDETCSDYNTCSRKGRDYWLQLHRVLAQVRPIDKTYGKAIFDRDYGCEFMIVDEDITPGVRRIRGDVAQHGFDWNWVEEFGVFSKNPVTGEEDKDTPYSNMFHTSKGLIVAVANYRRLDRRKTLPWSEIVYQAWHVAQRYDDRSKAINRPLGHPGGGPISTLQAVVQVDVLNAETRAVIKTIWDKASLEYNIGDQTWYKFNEIHTPGWFYALLGTVNVKGTVFLLKDHAAEIGKKTVTGIWVRWPSPNPDIWIGIGRRTSVSEQK
ncbi:MAG: hypothetical protein Q9209_006348 [Squamulea sp. 1 TL-2023]